MSNSAKPTIKSIDVCCVWQLLGMFSLFWMWHNALGVTPAGAEEISCRATIFLRLCLH